MAYLNKAISLKSTLRISYVSCYQRPNNGLSDACLNVTRSGTEQALRASVNFIVK